MPKTSPKNIPAARTKRWLATSSQRGGIASGLISLPSLYMHSPVGVVSLKGLEMIPQPFAGFALSLKKGEEFKEFKVKI